MDRSLTPADDQPLKPFNLTTEALLSFLAEPPGQPSFSDQTGLAAKRVPLDGPFHYRMEAIEDDWSGYVEYCEIANGFVVDFGDNTVAAPRSASVSAPDMLVVLIASAGDVAYEDPEGTIHSLRGPFATLFVQPPDGPPTPMACAGRERTVTLYVHREALSRLYSRQEQDLPSLLQAFLASDLARPEARHLAVDPGLLRCLDDLHSCKLSGRSRRIFVQSKALELLCQVIEALARDDRSTASPASGLTSRGILRAQQLLAENFAAPPSLDELARSVGMSRTRLCVGFKDIVGRSVFDYISDLRMDYALELMKDRTVSLTEIAHTVGFNHLSSFSIAIQRRFGATPSELKRRCDLLTQVDK